MEIHPLGPNPYFRGDPWISQVSDRNLLGLDRASPWALPRPSKNAVPDTIKVLVIRVEFQPDNTSRTTGDGTFDLSPYEQSPHPFDPLPHNKAYFEAHMKALRNYYLAVSDSQVYIDFEVFPESENIAYRLPDSMSYYGPEGWMGFDMADRMQQFFRDSWELAIAEGDFDIFDYDAYFVFHAGSDWQNDIASSNPDYVAYWPDIFIPSPDDLPTGYLKLPFKIADRIEDGIIMPEHGWQDGQITCINGAVAHEFGHQLGLVDLYNTGNFITQVGDFSLMDNGFAVGADIGFDVDEDGNVSDDEFYSVYGMFPGYPDAWSRAYLGFETPVEVVDDCDTIVLEACELPMNEGVTLIKIPINSYEYYLIENRQDDLAGDDGFYSLKRDSLTGVVIGALAVDTTKFTSALDFLLPGRGFLIWHIDETVAYSDVDGNGINNFNDNTLQWDLSRRFVALEEADGYEDLGTIITFGEPLDYFYYGTNFGPNTNPSTSANDGGFSGILVDSMSVSGDEMHLRIRFDNVVPTPDVITTIYPLYAPMQAGDLDGDGFDELLTEAYYFNGSAYVGCVLIWNLDGTPFIDNGITVSGSEFDGNVIRADYPVAATVNAERVTLPAVGNIDSDELAEVVGIDTEGWLHAWNPRDLVGGFMRELSGFPVELDSSAQRSVSLWDVDSDGELEIVAYANERWYLVDNDGSILATGDARGEIMGIAPTEQGLFVAAKRTLAKIIFFSWTGEVIREKQLSSGDVSYLARGDLDGDGISMEIACAGRSGVLFAFDSTLDYLGVFPTNINDTSLSSPVIVDIDGDDVLEVLSTGRKGLYIYEPTGIPHENAPFGLENVLASPIFGGEYALFPSGDGPIKAINSFGESPYGFPLGGAPSNAAPCFFKGSEGYGLALGSTNGSLLIWNNLENSLDDGAWPMWGADARHTFLQASEGSCPLVSGEDGIEIFYCYPNPAERSTIFRYSFSGSSPENVQIRVFDAANNLIASLDGQTNAGTPLELEWNTEKVGSGVYWARLSGDFKGKTISNIFRVAIVK
ncbi:hypothetical protein KAH81_04355 [bacterium]|nr:hypothetical protein [bacterium]